MIKIGKKEDVKREEGKKTRKTVFGFLLVTNNKNYVDLISAFPRFILSILLGNQAIKDLILLRMFDLHLT